jgi:hypothetical protein
VESYDRLEVLLWTIFDQNRVNFKKLFLENKKIGISKILTMDFKQIKAFSDSE